MFFKDVYNSLFNLNWYGKVKFKRTSKAVWYSLLLSFICGAIFSAIMYMKLTPIIEEGANKIYEFVPDFTLSQKGFSMDLDEPLEITFAGVNLYIDDDKKFVELVIEEKVDSDNEVIFVGNDGYGIVNGTTLKRGAFFADLPVLENIELDKDDFRIIYETIKMIGKDIVIILLFVAVVIGALYNFLRCMMYALLIKAVAFLKDSKIKYKEAYKCALFGTTFNLIYFVVLFFSTMNINLYCKIMMLEIITVIYMWQITSKVIKANRGKKK